MAAAVGTVITEVRHKSQSKRWKRGREREPEKVKRERQKERPVQPQGQRRPLHSETYCSPPKRSLTPPACYMTSFTLLLFFPVSLLPHSQTQTLMQPVSQGSHPSCGWNSPPALGPLLALRAPDYTTRIHPVHIKAGSTRPQEIMVATADVDLCHSACFQLCLKGIFRFSTKNVSQQAAQQIYPYLILGIYCSYIFGRQTSKQ